MLELHRTEKDSFADEIEDRLRELVLAYRVVELSRSDHLSEGDGEAYPVITQSGRTYRGRDQIEQYLDGLEREVRLGRTFQSDACYLDPDDPSRCL